jgi:hypothetical protein
MAAPAMSPTMKMSWFRISGQNIPAGVGCCIERSGRIEKDGTIFYILFVVNQLLPIHSGIKHPLAKHLTRPIHKLDCLFM